MSTNVSAILITGMPGVGKTTIIKKLVENLRKTDFVVNGFYTEEVRDESHKRIGFDVITFDGKRDILSRTTSLMNDNKSRPKVGQYAVFTEKFEPLALSTFKTNPDILIIDEIGKMELIGMQFESEIKRIVKDVRNKSKKLIATVPCSSRHQINIVEELKSLKGVQLFNITKSNRNQIFNQINDNALQLMQK